MSRQERGLPGDLERRPLAFTESRENPDSAGVAVLIVGLDPRRDGDNALDPLIWTITELKSKVETDKLAGQLSIPAETRKNGESAEDNVIGALAEFCNDTIFSSYVKNHLVKVDGKWRREKGITVGTGPADVAVVIYDGALDFPFKPTNADEVSPNGWMKKSELVAVYPNLRDLLKETLELDSMENLIRDALEDYESNPEKRKSVFPDDLVSIEKFNSEREFGVDMHPMSPDAKEVANRLPEAHRLIVEAIGLLAESQSQGKRDYNGEDRIVSELEKAIRNMDCYDYAVGISELDGSGIRAVKVPRGGFKSWGEKREKLRQEHRNPKSIYYSPPESYRLTPPTTGSVENKKFWGAWELQRGDELGYLEELGKDWYIISHQRSNGPETWTYCIVPISGIKTLKKLRPYRAHGM